MESHELVIDDRDTAEHREVTIRGVDAPSNESIHRCNRVRVLASEHYAEIMITRGKIREIPIAGMIPLRLSRHVNRIAFGLRV